MKNTPKNPEEKRGRKPKPADEVHRNRIVVKLTDAELLDFSAAAKRHHKSMSTWLRDLGIAAR